MDEALRHQLRVFKAQPSEENLAALVRESLRSGQGLFDIYDKSTLDQLFANRNVVIPSILGQIAALYTYLKGENHPWQTCRVLVGSKPSQVETHDDQGGQVILDEFMVYLRVFEPLPFRPYSKMLGAYIAEKVTWTDRNGWEDKEHPKFFTNLVEAIQKNVYRNPPRLEPALRNLVEFRAGLVAQEIGWLEEYGDFNDSVVAGTMDEVPRVLDTISAVIQYCINIVDNPEAVSQLHIAIEEARASGLFQWCDSTVEDIKTWIELKLMPRVVIDAAAALNAATS